MAVGVGGAIARGVVVVLNAPTQMSLPTAAPVVATPPALVMLGGAAALVAALVAAGCGVRVREVHARSSTGVVDSSVAAPASSLSRLGTAIDAAD